MSINTTSRVAGPYVGNDAQTVFAYAFKVFATSDLVVTRADTTGAETVLTQGVDYTATMNVDQDGSPGGNVTLTAGLTLNYTLTITSDVALLQQVVVTNEGGFFPGVFNGVFDRLTIFAQQLAEKLNRSIKFTKASALAGSSLTPIAGGYLRMNAGNTALEIVDKSTAAADLGIAVDPATSASAVADAEGYADTHKLDKAQNLADVADVPTARGNLGFVAGLNALWTAATAVAARTALGLGTAATVDTGTGANQIVKLDGNAKLPAVDGSQLTGINGLAFPVVNKTASFTHTAAQNSSMYEFTGALGTGVVLTVDPAVVGNTHWIGLHNRGAGPMLVTAASGTVEERTSIYVYPGERVILRSDGTDLRAVGRLKRVKVSSTTITGSPTTVDFEAASGDTEAVRWVLDFAELSGNGGVLGVRIKKSGAYLTTSYAGHGVNLATSPSISFNSNTALFPLSYDNNANPLSGEAVFRNVQNGQKCSMRAGPTDSGAAAATASIGCFGSNTNTATALQGVRVLTDSGATLAAGVVTLYVERE